MMTPRTDDGIQYEIRRTVTSITRFHNRTSLLDLITKLRDSKTTGTLSIRLSQGGLNAIELEEQNDAGTASTIKFQAKAAGVNP